MRIGLGSHTATKPCAGPVCRNDNLLLSRTILTDTRRHDISQFALHGASYQHCQSWRHDSCKEQLVTICMFKNVSTCACGTPEILRRSTYPAPRATQGACACCSCPWHHGLVGRFFSIRRTSRRHGEEIGRRVCPPWLPFKRESRSDSTRSGGFVSCRLGRILVSDVSNGFLREDDFSLSSSRYTEFHPVCHTDSGDVDTKTKRKGCRTSKTVIGQRTAWWQFHTQGPNRYPGGVSLPCVRPDRLDEHKLMQFGQNELPK